MSNQFYDYITSLLIEFFRTNNIKPGDRFYLQLDNQFDVNNLISALEKLEVTSTFKYKHEQGEEYLTFSIPIGNTQLVVAFTSDFVKPDFLVTLRNLVGEQKDVWNNTSLISIVSEQLDSIQGGSSDLQKEGMPLHPNSIFANLKTDIETSKIPKVDKIVLIDNLENIRKDQSFQHITFFEFEDIFITLQKGAIDDQEYHKFGIFKDPDLDKFTGKDQIKRLTENRELFDFIKRVHDFGLGDDVYETKFLPEHSKELKSEEWKEILFQKVHKFHEDYKRTKKTKKVDFDTIKLTDKLKCWDKQQGESAAGRRKRNIIIFNPENKEEIELQLSFNFSGNVKSLSTEFLKIKDPFIKQISFDVKTKNIIGNIHTEKNKVTFVKFSYKHDDKVALGAEFNIAVIPIEPLILDHFKSKYSVE
ncbi:DNA phosphorothioation-dependent restriction protein DptH, partial [Neobacillus drentensis]